jgi:sugar phosphate isomerase/epimerase
MRLIRRPSARKAGPARSADRFFEHSTRRKETMHTKMIVAMLSIAVLGGVLAAGEECMLASQKLGWELGVQSYSFNRFTFFESVDKAKAMNLRYIEAYPGQKLGGELGNAAMGPDLPISVLAQVKNKLDKAGIKLVAFGVVGLSNDEKEARKVFDFAKVMGIQVITSEPEQAAFPLLDRLTAEYDIKVALHNHPKPSRYWDPQVVLDALKNSSDRIGSCADTGHWIRSGLDPLECVKKLSGHIVSFHLKDLNERSPGAHDVPWGTGVANMDAIVAEMLRQGFKGPISIEYEHNWLNSMPEITKCIEYFEAAAKKVAPK